MRHGPVRMAVVAVLIAVLAAPGPAAGQTVILNWGEVLPGFSPRLDLSSSNICTSGRVQCVQSVLRTMARDFHRLARACDHDAVFQLGYLRTTEAYFESSQIPGFYADVPWMHHYDAVFAEYYLGPQRAWARGRTAEVPPAWQAAFAASDRRELSTTGSFLMGMNAHINRDLPFVLDDIGLTDGAGGSRKPDHERVNVFLANVGDDLAPEMAARFDPSWTSPTRNTVVTGLTVQQIVQEWRERAWNNAWLMTYTAKPVADLVAQGIEAGSAQLAEMIRTATPGDAAARDAYCASNWHNWPGGDGTYFDGQVEPLADAPAMAMPVVHTTLSALAAQGVDVRVSLSHGVNVTVADHLLVGLPPVGTIPPGSL